MKSHHTTDDLLPSQEEPTEEQFIRFVDIHIYEQQEEEERDVSDAIESNLEAERPEEQQYIIRAPHTQRTPLLVACLSLLGIVLIGGLVWIFVSPLMTPDTTITIVPVTQQIRTTAPLLVTTGQATASQVQGRTLAALTMNQEQTVPTTGNGYQDAHIAHGFLTFYNAAPYEQTIAAGTLVTGTDGVQVMTNQDAIIAAAIYPTFGQITVAAQAILAGPAGNIRAGDIYGPCCRLNVSATNSAFAGGQAARDYPMVTPHDISSVVASLQTSVRQSAQAALQAQVRGGETLITLLPCQQRVQADHHAGEEASHVTVTLSETCTGVASATQALQTRMTERLAQVARTRLGDGYIMQGTAHISVTQASRHANAILLQVSGVVQWGYVFSAQQQAQIKQQVAGKSRGQAQAILLHTPGVQTVSVDGTTMPTDGHRIHLAFVVIQ